jgi:purine-binding chemotaxis protein CheW
MDMKSSPSRTLATFLLGSGKNIEMAVPVEYMLETTPLTGGIQAFPTGVDYLERFMLLREEAIPVVNMKKRLGMKESDYLPDSKIAVVTASGLRFGLMFDDIRDVLSFPSEELHPVHPALQGEGSVISEIVRLGREGRIIEVLDPARILDASRDADALRDSLQAFEHNKTLKNRTYSRYVVIETAGQLYGVPVNQAREITYFRCVDDVYENGCIQGTLKLRGETIPVIYSTLFFGHGNEMPEPGEESRILVLTSEDFCYGLSVDNVREIVRVADDDILDLPHAREEGVTGVYQPEGGGNVLLVCMDALIDDHRENLRSMARIRSEELREGTGSRSGTADVSSYLVFSIGRRMAVALNEVQEIIETQEIMRLPGSDRHDRRVLNLRGTLIPVLNLREFYGEEPMKEGQHPILIVAQNEIGHVAFEVDRVKTLVKDVRSHGTPALNSRLNDKRDTLDRLIEMTGETGTKDHVFVVNIKAVQANHLGVIGAGNVTIENEQENVYDL